MMNWLTGSKLNEARRLVKQLADPAKRERAAAELYRLGQEAIPALIEALQARDARLAGLAGQLLIRFGPAAVPALTQSLLGDHPEIRGQVADLLAEIRDPMATPALLQALGGEYYTVRARAAHALGAIGDRGAIQPLLEALSDREPEVRSGAALALGHFKDPRTFNRLADLLLEDPEIGVRQAAAKALGETRNVQALPYLMEALHDSFWWYEREQAAEVLLRAIETIGQPGTEPLIDALSDPEGTIRRFAAMLLGRLRDPRAIEPLGLALYDMHYEVGRAAAESLACFGPAAVQVLLEALHHPEAWLRQHAVAGLGRVKDDRSLPALLNMLKDPDRDVQKEAIGSLMLLGDARALPALRQITSNRNDRELLALARQALERLQGAS